MINGHIYSLKRTLLTIVVSSALIACSDSDTSRQMISNEGTTVVDDVVATVEGIDWTLASYKRINAQSKLVLDNSTYTFKIGPSKVTGTFDCNGFSASYSLEGNILRLGNRESNGAFCDHQADFRYDEQNKDLNYLFAQDMYITLGTNVLVAKTSAGDEYLFEKESKTIESVESMEDVTWHLTSYSIDADVPVSLIDGTQYQFRLVTYSLPQNKRNYYTKFKVTALAN